jgi:hypothetical protein
MPKMRSPINFTCTHANADGSKCKAAIGEKCNWLGDDATYFHATKFHAERLIAQQVNDVDYSRAKQDAIHASL